MQKKWNMIVKNDLFDYENRYIYQDTSYFKFSIDSILLAEFTSKVCEGDLILDMCAGNMAVPLILSTKYNNKIIGFEIQKNIYNLAVKSIEENKLTNQLTIINDDIKNIDKYYKRNIFPIIVANPPYFKVNNSSKNLNVQDELKIARHEVKLKLEDVFAIAKKNIAPEGHLFVVHRAERLDEIILLGEKYNIRVKSIQFISTKKDKGPNTVIVECVQNAKNGIKIHNEICIEGTKSYQNIFESR